jgi:hypothetical protein
MGNNIHFSYMAGATLCGLGVILVGCVSAPQTVGNIPTAAAPTGTPKVVQKTAFSGIPQILDHYAELNADCTSVGIETVNITRTPSHGTVVMQNNVESYPSFPPTNQRYECNKTKTPSIRITYTSDRTFVGNDRFTVHRVSHTGNLLIYEYVVTVEQLHNAEAVAAQP